MERDRSGEEIEIRVMRFRRQKKRGAIFAAILFGMQSAAQADESTFCQGPDNTVLVLTTLGGDHIELEMTRYKDPTNCPSPAYCLRAGVKLLSHDGSISQGFANGIIDGPGFYLQVKWQNPGADPMDIDGKLDNGGGKGVAGWQEVDWTAHTVNGCMDWPSDPQVVANCTGAAGFSRGLRQYVENRGGCGQNPMGKYCATRVAACDPAFSETAYNEFIGQCVAALAKEPAPNGAPDNPDGDPRVTTCEQFVSNRDANQACRSSVSQDDFKKAAAGVCSQSMLPPKSDEMQVIRNADPLPSFGLAPTTSPVHVDLAPRIFQDNNAGDPIPSIGQPANSPLRNPVPSSSVGAPIPSLSQPADTPIRTRSPFLPREEPTPSFARPSNAPFRNDPSPSEIFKRSGSAATGPTSSPCPPYMIPDGHGGCSGVPTVQPGGNSVLKPNTSGGPAAARAIISTVQPSNSFTAKGGLSSTPPTGVPMNAQSGVLKPGGANSAKAIQPPTPNPPINSSVLKQGAPAANAIRNQQFTPGLH